MVSALAEASPMHLLKVRSKADRRPLSRRPMKNSLAGGMAKARLVRCSASQASRPGE
jgi:hypothetical protein